MSSKKKLMALAVADNANTLAKSKERIKSRAMLRESQAIALKVLEALEAKDWSQKKLAEALQVNPQQVTKIVSGKENLTIETQVKLQEILDIPILATYYERRDSQNNEPMQNLGSHLIRLDAKEPTDSFIYQKEKPAREHKRPIKENTYSYAV